MKNHIKINKALILGTISIFTLGLFPLNLSAQSLKSEHEPLSDKLASRTIDLSNKKEWLAEDIIKLGYVPNEIIELGYVPGEVVVNVNLLNNH
ncbi:hypothetical protein IPJ72_07465 [Candidatus Peregrinibacteria bacterium]|nr:MAG: hypothetical protein IPJ72_07465 [Candidatus Peregrinibacteria bacterium]